MTKHESARNTIYYIYFIFIFFPYITFIDIGTDTQPWAILLSIFIFITFKPKFYKIDIYLGTIAICSLLLILASNKDLNTARSLINYLAMFIIAHSSFLVLKTQRINIDNIIKLSIIAWIVAGTIQKLTDNSIFSFMLPAVRTTEDRGVVGLAPEPTFYGIALIFFAIYISHLETKNKSFYIILCLFGIFALAQSSMAILFIFIFAIFFIITNFKIKYVLYITTSIAITITSIQSLAPESRMQSLIEYLISEPESLLLVDASINDRFFHIFFSLKGSLDHFLLPRGYSEWIPYAENEIFKYSDVVIIEWFSLGGRIMSGYGSAFFELGFIALFIPFTLTWLLWRLYSDNKKKFVFYAFSINCIMLSAIPIGFTLFSFYMGFLHYLCYKKRQSVEKSPKDKKSHLPLSISSHPNTNVAK